jgi:hypothetical protein
MSSDARGRSNEFTDRGGASRYAFCGKTSLRAQRRRKGPHVGFNAKVEKRRGEKGAWPWHCVCCCLEGEGGPVWLRVSWRRGPAVDNHPGVVEVGGAGQREAGVGSGCEARSWADPGRKG